MSTDTDALIERLEQFRVEFNDSPIGYRRIDHWLGKSIEGLRALREENATLTAENAELQINNAAERELRGQAVDRLDRRVQALTAEREELREEFKHWVDKSTVAEQERDALQKEIVDIREAMKYIRRHGFGEL